MANKDHSLDQKIISSATKEFLTHGFQKASINRIAACAGVTTGAIYTRYRNKDDLFCSLLQEAAEELKRCGEIAGRKYGTVTSKEDLEPFLDAMQSEMNCYLNAMFRYYDQCVLLFCKSTGSSAEQFLLQAMDQKVQQTVAFLEGLSHKDMSGAGLIIKEQFGLFHLVLEAGYSKEKTISCIEMINQFNAAGWQALFQKNM